MWRALPQNVEWRDGLRPGVGGLRQREERFAHVGMGDRTSQRAPQPFDAVGVRVIGRRLDQHELSTQVIEQLPQQERALGRVNAQVVEQNQRDPSASLGALDSTSQWHRTGRLGDQPASRLVWPPPAQSDRRRANHTSLTGPGYGNDS
jgi:hypothetical protein